MLRPAVPDTVPGSYRRGAFFMVLATLLFVALDTTAKYLTQLYPVEQIIRARFTFHLLFACAVLGSQPGGTF